MKLMQICMKLMLFWLWSLRACTLFIVYVCFNISLLICLCSTSSGDRRILTNSPPSTYIDDFTSSPSVLFSLYLDISFICFPITSNVNHNRKFYCWESLFLTALLVFFYVPFKLHTYWFSLKVFKLFVCVYVLCYNSIIFIIKKKDLEAAFCFEAYSWLCLMMNYYSPFMFSSSFFKW